MNKKLLYLFTWWGWALLQEPLIVQSLKNFPAFHGTRRFNTVFTRALHWSLSWAISIQSTPEIIINYIKIVAEPKNTSEGINVPSSISLEIPALLVTILSALLVKANVTNVTRFIALRKCLKKKVTWRLHIDNRVAFRLTTLIDEGLINWMPTRVKENSNQTLRRITCKEVKLNIMKCYAFWTWYHTSHW
jgi:hypothetical protein